MRNLNMEIHLQGVGSDQLTPLPPWPGSIPTTMHRCLLLLFVGMACTTASAVASQSWKRALPLPEASQEAVTAANAVINQSISQVRKNICRQVFQCHLRLSNSCDVSGHSSTACELASEIAGRESELSMGDMLATSETLLDLLGDSETSH